MGSHPYKACYNKTLHSIDEMAPEGSPRRRGLSRAAKDKLNRLKAIIRRNDRNCWLVGDLCSDLLEQHRVALQYLARATGYSKPRLSEFHLTAKSFSKEVREGYSFQACLMARKIHQRFKTLGMTLLQIRQEVVRSGLTRYLDVKTHFVRKMIREQANSSLARTAELCLRSENLVNHCHHADYRDVLPLLTDGAAKLVIADPPYAAYRDFSGGRYFTGKEGTNGLRSECDNGDPDPALQTTCDLFAICKGKMAPGGVLLLFQAGCKPDRPEVLEAATENGWSCRYAVTWLKTDKAAAAPGNCWEPYAVSTERILVFSRAGDRLEWHEEGLSRSDVLLFPTITKTAASRMARGEVEFNEVHLFQKPDSLCEFLVRKHSHPGELVVEPFGCSGSGSVAAARLGRRWLYVESNADNFAWGSRRVEEAAEKTLSAVAG